MKEKLPNSTTSLVLGILSIVTCWCYGLPGIILGVIGFILGNKSIKEHNEDPYLYEGIGNAKAGKITSLIGVILSILFIGYIVWFISTYLGWDALQDEELLMERIEELKNLQ